MADLNDVLSMAAEAETYRNGWKATNPGFGLDARAVGTLTGGSLPEAPMQGQMVAQGGMPMLDPLELLRAQSEAKDEELSLKTIKKKEKEKIMRSFKDGRDVAREHYSHDIEPEILHRRNVYEGDKEYYKKVFPHLSETSNWVSKDVKTSCTWILTQLMEAFTSSEAPLSVKGVNVEDDEVASKIQELVRYQLEKKNDWYQFCMAELSYALSENFCTAKVWWKREEEHTPMELMLDLNDTDTILSLVAGVGSGEIQDVKVKEIDGAEDFLKVTYEVVKIKNNHPVVEYIPTSELRYTPDAANIQDCKFVAHRKIVRGDYLKRCERDGIYQDVDEALKKYQGDNAPTALDRDNDEDRYHMRDNKKNTDNDNASKEVELYEAYLQVDYNNDGIYENVIVHAVGDVPIRIAKNDFEFPPFFVCEAMPSPNRVFNLDSYTDVLEQQQDLKTALMRQIITNVAKNNQPRIFVNERNVDVDALMGNEEIVPMTQGTPQENIFVPPQLPLSSVTMEVIQYAQSEIESQSGSTRYNQGLDSNSLNSTATGITAILGMAEKRNKMVARSIAESFFIPIYKFIILLNQKYLEDEQMIRLTSKTLAIRKEDLDIDYDLIVNVGQGASTREAQIQYLLMVLNQIYPQLANNGIVNAKSYYNLVTKLLETLGLRDVSQYLLDPESQEAQAAAQQQVEAQAQAQAQAFQNQLQLYAAKGAIPRVNVDINDMPPDVQRQYLKDKLGIETTEKAIAEHEVLTNA